MGFHNLLRLRSQRSFSLHPMVQQLLPTKRCETNIHFLLIVHNSIQNLTGIFALGSCEFALPVTRFSCLSTIAIYKGKMLYMNIFPYIFFLPHIQRVDTRASGFHVFVFFGNVRCLGLAYTQLRLILIAPLRGLSTFTLEVMLSQELLTRRIQPEALGENKL